MVLFGGYHTAERFFDDDRLTAHFPGPGSYAQVSTCTSSAVGVATKYAAPLVEDGVVRPDGSAIGFRERDSWVRGKEGPKGLTSLSAGNAFVCPATYSTASGERAIRGTAPAAVVNTLEPRYLSPSTRCLTPDHERAAKGVGSPGPGTYYPSCEAWDFAPPAEWNRVNKAMAAQHRTQRHRRFNAKLAWGEPAIPRSPDPARAAETRSKEERVWLSESRGPARPNISPRCMWINGVNTRRGLHSWGDIATNSGPIHVGYSGDCCPPDRRPTPRGRQNPRPRGRGPVHSCEARATSPDFREVRYLSRDLMRRGAGTVVDTPGPGQYNVRVPLRRGTTFAGPRPKCSKTATVRAFVASAATAVASSDRAGQARRAGSGAPQGAPQGVWPSPPPPAAVSQRLSTPLMGKESPGPAYNLPSDFDLKLVNKKTFQPPSLRRARKKRQVPREKEPGATFGRGQSATTSLPQARRVLSRVAANSGGSTAGGTALGVPVKTCLGRGLLLRIRADGMTFVRLPWGVLYTREALTRGRAARACGATLEDPAMSTKSEGGVMEQLPTTVKVGDRADATPSEEGVFETERDAPQPTGGA